MTLSVVGKLIVKASVQDFKLNLEWCDGDWESWDELQSSSDFTSVKDDAQRRLDQAKVYASSKGKGKTPLNRGHGSTWASV